MYYTCRGSAVLVAMYPVCRYRLCNCNGLVALRTHTVHRTFTGFTSHDVELK
jgi:hypothetical protein